MIGKNENKKQKQKWKKKTKKQKMAESAIGLCVPNTQL